MKKLLFLLAALSLVLAACSEEKTAEPKSEKAAVKEEKANPASDMMKFYVSISKAINEVDADLNAFEDAQAEATLPEGAELETMKAAAKTSAGNAAAKVEELEVPASLSEQQESIDAALTKIQEAYTMKSEALAAEGEYAADEANAKFEEADADLNAVLEEVGLVGSSIYNEVSL